MKAALLLVDLQRDFLATPDLQPDANTLVARTRELLQLCRQRGIAVIHVWTTVDKDNDRRLPHWRAADRWMCVTGTPGHASPESLHPIEGETVIHKTGFNAFANSRLEKHLRSLGCDTVILAGLHLHACVRTAAVESLERNFRVFVAEEAVASNDPVHAAATRRWLGARCVTFASSKSVLAQLDGVAAESLVHRSPRRTEEVLFEAPVATAGDVAAAVATAQHAWTRWLRTTVSSRQQILGVIATRLEAGAEDFARQMAEEIGKPVRHGVEEVRRAAANVRDVARRVADNLLPKREAAGLVRHQPLGVVGIISAWNNPVAIPIGKIAPALAYGNTVVWKPAPAATNIARKLLGLIHDSGVSNDAVQLLTGDHSTAQHIAADINVSAVTLTGSLAAGHSIQEICARRILPLQAELSGNNAAIVWEDADFKFVAEQIAWGAFAFAGQRCTANRRVIVSARCFDLFLRELQMAAERLPWGEPMESPTEIGPVISTSKRDDQSRLVAEAESSGALRRIVRVHESIANEKWTLAGAYAQPVIVCCDKPDHLIVQAETMSPLLVVQRAEDFDHALALNNGVRHGLIASLFSNDEDVRRKFSEEAQAGILKFNSSTAGVDVTLPFGGWKASSLGPPEHGEGDAQFYTRAQAVYGLANG
ncbi:MAG: aldehyde dehydrogenase family protein [Verrucomicrobia bacterium]|nr:aldehyde dehydrogenase family protein [Verrucomicrobiota bacterium]